MLRAAVDYAATVGGKIAVYLVTDCLVAKWLKYGLGAEGMEMPFDVRARRRSVDRGGVSGCLRCFG